MNASKFAEQRAQPGTGKAGLPWTPAERQRLLDAMRRGTGVDDVAVAHERTPGAIRARMNKEFVDAVAGGQTAAQVARTFNADVAAVERALAAASKPSVGAADKRPAGPAGKRPADPAGKRPGLIEMINATDDVGVLRSAHALIARKLAEHATPDDEPDAPVLGGFAFRTSNFSRPL